MSHGFESFSPEHFSILIALGVITYFIIRLGIKSEEPLKTNLGLILAGITFSTLIIEAIYKLAFGIYDIYNDLPFFLCDLVGVLLPFILYFKNRKWIGILYFWAMAGTLQALITPDLEDGFPTFHFFRYFITHAGIVAAVLYAVIVWKIRIEWRDFLNAIIYAQVYLVTVHIFNNLFGSTYSYTVAKPQGATVLDYMGPWPWYIFWAEILMVALFLLLMIPFLWKKRPFLADAENP